MKLESDVEGSPRDHGGFVGVDVVDLSRHRSAGRASDQRFLDRVFTPSEVERIRAAPDPDLEVWVLWAAKEAAFKVVSKLLGEPPVFRHRAFTVVDAPGDPPREVEYQGMTFSVTADSDESRVVVHAWDDPSSLLLVSHLTVEEARKALGATDPLERWQASRFSPRELEAVHSFPSALVRLLARRDAAELMEVREERLSICCPPGPSGLRPPYLHLDGAVMRRADVSLSHDGIQLAWALRVPWSP